MPASDPIHGWMYQSNLFLLYLIQGVFSGYSFRLGTEIPEGKKFDDVVYEWIEGEITKYLLFQAKSKINKNEKITLENLITDSDGDFSLTKYFFSYMDSKKEKLFTKRVIENVILFTNIDLDCKLLESKSIFDEQNYDAANIPHGLRIIFQNYGDGGKIYKLRKEVSALLKPKLLNYNLTRLAGRLVKCVLTNNVIKDHDKNDIFFYYHKVLGSEVLDIKKKRFKDAFISGNGFKDEAKTFREEFIQILNKKSEGVLILQNINEAIENKEIIIGKKPVGLTFSSKFGIGDDKTWPKNAITDKEIKEFLNVFILAVNQPNEKKLGEKVKSEIEKKYNLNLTTVENIYNSLFMKTLRRIQGKDKDKFLSFQDAKEMFEDFIKMPSIYFEFKYSNPQFVGRKNELQELHEKLTRRNGNNLAVISQMTTVSGLGGIGKSELAKHYSCSHLDFYKDVIWINAESENSLEQSFEKLAEKLDIKLEDSIKRKKNIKSIVEEVYKWFDNRKTLIIFDNAENCEFIQQFLPLQIPPNQSKPNILITTRDQNWPNLEIINLNVLNDNDSKKFIKKYLEINDNCQDNEIYDLVKELQCFPLALQQAAAHIKYEQNSMGNSNFSVKDYLKKYQEKTKYYLDSKMFYFNIGNGYTKTTFTTWKITFEKIAVNEFGDLALKVLYMIAYLNPVNIPIENFLSKIEDDDDKFPNAVGLLNRFSMIKLENGFVNVHRLVQEVIRIDLKEQKKNEDVLKDIFKVLDEYDLENSMIPLKTLIPHFETCLIYFEELASEKKDGEKQNFEKYINSLYFQIADIHCRLGNDLESKKFMQKCLKIEKEIYGEEHIGVGVHHLNLGLNARILQNQPNSLEMMKKAAYIFEKYLAKMSGLDIDNLSEKALAEKSCLDIDNLPKHSFEITIPKYEKEYGTKKALELLKNLSDIYLKTEDFPKRKEKLKEFLLNCEKYLGAGNIEFGLAQVHISIVYINFNDYIKGKEILERILLIFGNTFEMEKNNFDTLRKIYETCTNSISALNNRNTADCSEQSNVLNDLTCSYEQTKQTKIPEKQKEFLEKVLSVYKKYFKQNTIVFGIGLIRISIAYIDLQENLKGKDLLEEVLLIFENHSETSLLGIDYVIDISDFYKNLKEFSKQKELLKRVLHIYKKNYGVDHVKYGEILVHLSDAYNKLNIPAKQKELLEQVLPIYKNHYGSDHVEYGKVLFKLSYAYSDLNDPIKQIQILEIAAPIYKTNYGDDYVKYGIVLFHLSCAYSKRNNLAKQKELLERVLPIYENHYGADHIQCGYVLLNLSCAYSNNSTKQKELLERALPIYENHYGADHVKCGNVLLNLSCAYSKLNNPVKQEELLKIVLPIYEKHYGADHVQCGNVLFNMSIAYDLSNDPTKQKELLEKVLPIYEKHYGSNHVECGNVLLDLSCAYSKLNDPTKQKELLEKVLPIYEKHYGANHVECGNVLLNLSCAYSKLNDPTKQKELLEKVLPIYENHYGADHIQCGYVLLNLSCAYSNNSTKQKELLERALPIYENHYGADHVQCGNVLLNLSCAYSKLNNPMKQEELLKIVLPIYEKHYGADHVQCGNVLFNMSIAYDLSNDPTKQKELLEKVLPIYEKHYGANHVECDNVLLHLSSANSKVNNRRKQEELLKKYFCK